MIKASNPGIQRALLGCFGLPMGLLMVLGGGGELVTGNMAICTAAVAACVESHHWFGGIQRILQTSLPPSNRTRSPRFLDHSSSLPKVSTTGEKSLKHSFRNTHVEGILVGIPRGRRRGARYASDPSRRGRRRGGTLAGPRRTSGRSTCPDSPAPRRTRRATCVESDQRRLGYPFELF